MFQQTNDGSQTLYSEQFNEHYHSIHGAKSEAMHVFIKHGLEQFKDKESIAIFEMGFGTGLNAYLSLKHKAKHQTVFYHSIDLYPLESEVFEQLQVEPDLDQNDSFIKDFHHSPWEQRLPLTDSYTLLKSKADITTINLDLYYDLIYFDAFSPRHQEECWAEHIFNTLYSHLKPKGILVTYCAKGSLKRLLKQIGFRVETLTGPPGKREMIRAHK